MNNIPTAQIIILSCITIELIYSFIRLIFKTQFEDWKTVIHFMNVMLILILLWSMTFRLNENKVTPPPPTNKSYKIIIQSSDNQNDTILLK